MNFAAELFLSAFAMMLSIVIISQVVAKLLGAGKGEEEE